MPLSSKLGARVAKTRCLTFMGAPVGSINLGVRLMLFSILSNTDFCRCDFCLEKHSQGAGQQKNQPFEKGHQGGHPKIANNAGENQSENDKETPGL